MKDDRVASVFKSVILFKTFNSCNMRKHFLPGFTLVLLFSIFLNSNLFAQDGAATFQSTCAACHTIGKGKLVGPDLAGVTERRSEDWLIKFVKSSQSLIKSGDKTADSLFQAYNQVMMPDHPSLDDAKIKEVLAYIKTTASAATGSSATVSSVGTETSTASQNKWQWNDFFTFPNTVLLVMILIMLIMIVVLVRINNRLTEQLIDLYSSDRSFFRK